MAGIFSWKPHEALKHFAQEKRIFVVESTNNILKVANKRKILKDEKNAPLDLSMLKFLIITRRAAQLASEDIQTACYGVHINTVCHLAR